jgi:hypothetical protein
MTLTINQSDLAQWIRDSSVDGLMLTISRPHAKLGHLPVEDRNAAEKVIMKKIEAIHMEPVISQIVTLANQYVLGKHKHFDRLKGLVTCEHWKEFPHFHITFQKPANMDFDVFEKKLTQLAARLNHKSFVFDFRDRCRFFDPIIYRTLMRPCFPGFAFVSRAHERLGGYLTKGHAKYFILTERDFNLDRDQMDIYVDFHNKQPDQAKEIANAKHLFQSERDHPVQLQMVPMAHTTNA